MHNFLKNETSLKKSFPMHCPQINFYFVVHIFSRDSTALQRTVGPDLYNEKLNDFHLNYLCILCSWYPTWFSGRSCAHGCQLGYFFHKRKFYDKKNLFVFERAYIPTTYFKNLALLSLQNCEGYIVGRLNLILGYLFLPGIYLGTVLVILVCIYYLGNW